MFEPIFKHIEVRQEYSANRGSVFPALLSVFGNMDKHGFFVFDILHPSCSVSCLMFFNEFLVFFIFLKLLDFFR